MLLLTTVFRGAQVRNALIYRWEKNTMFLRNIMACLPLVLVAAYSGNTNAQAPHACPSTIIPGCTKEIRVYNNLGPDRTLYVVWQGSKQLQVAVGNCPAGPNGGDVWLQRALSDTTKCYPVNNTYLAFINPKTGIKNGEFVSISVPWWSKSTDRSSDPYVDWWRAGRIYLFDDQTALNDSYLDPGKTTAQLAAPVISCTTMARNSCVANELAIYKVPDGSSALIGDHTPFQLNEVTFADIGDVPTTGGEFRSLNLNYNVSYVDQIYLPLAIGPIGANNIGYMGTITDVTTFRHALDTFSGNGTKWPIYNNPKNKYPSAGIRVPSTLAAFNFYMAPTVNPPGVPVIIPASPPTVLQETQTNWQNCTAGSPVDCPQSAMYQPINQAFLSSYKGYVDTCRNIPSYLTQMPGSNPPVPSNPYAFLRFVHGWVPFNVSCPQPDLPTANLPPTKLGNAPINYIALQYNWEQTTTASQWFNPYTQFIHGVLNANAYAFSIDDAASVANVAGSGLVFAVGGPNGLLNTTQFPPPLPTYYPWYTFSVALGAGGPGWKSYQLCAPSGKPSNEVMFPPGLQLPNSPPGWGMNPAAYTFPCTVTLTDHASNRYQFKILKAGIPPAQIWPPYPSGVGFDTTVVSCPTFPNFKAPQLWCSHINEIAKQNTPPVAPQYNLIGPMPLN
jgi:hypothetical protein